MDFIAASPEGQYLITHMYYLNGNQPFTIATNNLGNSSNSKNINIDFYNLAHYNYPVKGNTNQYADTSLVHLLYHEMYHQADPELKYLRANSLGEYQQKEDLIENKTIAATNRFLAKYLPNEPQREPDYSRQSQFSNYDNVYGIPPADVSFLCTDYSFGMS